MSSVNLLRMTDEKYVFDCLVNEDSYYCMLLYEDKNDKSIYSCCGFL